MNTITIILAFFTAITSLIAAISSVLGIYQKRRIETLSLKLEKANKLASSANNELYKVYLNVRELLKIEEDLSSELDIGKKTTRKGYNTDKYIQPKHVENRIKELEQKYHAELI